MTIGLVITFCHLLTKPSQLVIGTIDIQIDCSGAAQPGQLFKLKCKLDHRALPVISSTVTFTEETTLSVSFSLEMRLGSDYRIKINLCIDIYISLLYLENFATYWNWTPRILNRLKVLLESIITYKMYLHLQRNEHPPSFPSIHQQREFEEIFKP